MILRSGSMLAALALLVNASVWGLSWLPFKMLYARGLHPLWTISVIFAGALLILALVRGRSFLVLLRHPELFLLAVVAGLTNVGFTWSITIGDVVRVSLLFYLMPVWSILLAWLLLRERPTRAALLRLALALAGIVLVLWQPGTHLPLPHGLADWLALMAGACFALNNVLLRRWRGLPEEGRAVAMFVGGLGMAVLFALCGAAPSVPPIDTTGLLLVLALSLAFLAGNLGLQYGAARLPAHVTALVMLSEVVIAAFSSALLGVSHPTAMVWVGGALILLSAALATRRRGQG